MSWRQSMFSRAIEDFHARKTLCTALGCDEGYCIPDRTDIDDFTHQPRRLVCVTCDGLGFVNRK